MEKELKSYRNFARKGLMFLTMTRNLIINQFYCSECGFKMELPRQKSKKRETGHLKRLYCCRCKQEINFVECNNTSYSYIDYLRDKENGIFNTEGES